MASSSTEDTSDMDFFEYVASITIPLEEIKSATNNFAKKNLIARGSYANVYKGRLSQSGELIDVVVRKCLKPNVNVVVNDITMYKDYKHQNIISLFKVDDTDDQALTIHKFEANGSLDKHLTGSTLTWMQRLQICVGVAHALRYLHSGLKDDYSVIHGNVKSSKILLDHNWEPKLHDFRCAVKVKRHDLYITSNYNGALEYKDPAFESTGGLTNKSDVFSFGVVLFEVLFGRKASDIQDNEDKGSCFVKMARNHYDEKKLRDMIDPDLLNQMDSQSLNIFSETAYRCLKEQRAKRPDMEQIVKKLESALELHQSLVHSPAAVEDASSTSFKGGLMDHLKVPLSEIKTATNNFSQRCLIGLGGYGMVYIAELKSCFDGTKTVAIKRILKRRDKETEKSFMEEIDMLSKAKHRNVVSLLGFCDEDDEMILICEYASKGSLDKYLGIDSATNFTWAQRIQICLDIAHGLHHLHNGMQGENAIVHRDIKSENILMDDNWVAKIADFGLSKLHQQDQNISTLVTNCIAGTPYYLDPVYEKSGRLKKKSDIYSFGVVLFEILCGRLAYDEAFNGMGLAEIARQCYKDGTLKKLVDPKIKEADENIFVLNGGVNQDSLHKYFEIAHKCVALNQNDRPGIEDVIKELEEALRCQEENKDSLHISFEVIKSSTKNFSKIIGEGKYWKQYEGGITHANRCTNVIVKRWDSNFPQSHHQFLTELQILNEYKHENIISLVGYCNEMDEKIIVYENASNGSLDKHLEDANLTWIRRLKIGIDVARGLEFLHTSGSVMHRDIKCASILLDADWKPKISNFEWSNQLSDRKSIEHVTDDNAYGSLSYVSPEDKKQGYLTRESDTYSLGVVLKEMLWGRLTEPHELGVPKIVHNGQEILYHQVLESIKGQIDRKSLNTYTDIAGLCLAYKKYRPRVKEVITNLEKALNLQISSMARIYDSTEIMKKDLHHIFSKGTLLKNGKVWLSLGRDGERSEMVSARNFSYKNRSSLKWRSVEGSRFPKVAELINISNLKIQIKISSQFISPSVNHKVHLIFRFYGPRKSQAKRMYVNLKYKIRDETLHAYFATWREDGWMMIELFQSINHKEDTDFVVQLESISRGYCGNSSIYIEGIEFQATENVSYEKVERLKEVQEDLKDDSNTDEVEKQEIMLSAKKVVSTSSTSMGRYLGRDKYGVRTYRTHQIHQDSIRFSGAIEFQRHQVFRIRWKIQRQLLSANTKNVCYLVFRLSEKCYGLHAPILVRDLFHPKERRILYFRSPHTRSLQDGDWIPEKRKDGWMEVILWIFNSGNEIKYDDPCVRLKLITYEGTLSGLIVRGIEFRPLI